MIVSVTGGSGFIGRHLLSSLAASPGIEVRALARSGAGAGAGCGSTISWHQGDLEDSGALRTLMAPDGTLIHLAYPGWTHERHLAAATSMADIARGIGLRRLILCSTAVVAGKARDDRITEDTACEPVLAYERTKFEIERTLAARAAGAFEFAVLRPTAVFGPGGRNLVKLATDLTTGSRAVNYLRSSLYGRRRMNLVAVENVVGALMFLVARYRLAVPETYIVSDDDDPANNFRDVEAALMRHLGVPAYPLSPLPLPRAVLGSALRMVGRSATNPSRIYDASRLRRAGWRPALPFQGGLARFAAWFAGTR